LVTGDGKISRPVTALIFGDALSSISSAGAIATLVGSRKISDRGRTFHFNKETIYD
jgi:hypothetical protein